MHMKRFSYILTAVLVLAACQEEKELVIADHGPSQTITCDASALMGSVVRFSVDLQDEIPLSTLKVALLFDETVVADTTIRTKTTGSYEGFLKVPFEKDIPDGEATLRFVSQNIQFGTTTEEKTVAVSRPDFEYLTLIAGGNEYRMSRTGRNEYASEPVFNGSVDATIVTAPFDADGRKISFGFSANTGIAPGASGLIPFSDTTPGYVIRFNTLNWTGAPFVTIELNSVQANMASATAYVAVLNLEKGQAITLTGAPFGLDEVDLDPDFFTEDGKFNAVSGLYKVTIMLDQKYFYVERMVTQTEYASINSGAIWMIGEANQYGKPLPFSAGWSPDNGALCLAEVEPGIFQLTQVAGTQLALSSLNVKLFHQKGWGGEFGGGSYASVVSDLIYAGENDGNIHLVEGKKLDMGGIYRFTVDLTGGTSAAVLKFEKIGQNEVEAESISFAGVEAELAGTDLYMAVAGLAQGQSVAVTGIPDIADFTIDSDFFETESAGNSKLIPVDGRYKATINLATKYIAVERVNEAGGPIELNDADCTGAVWMIGDSCFGKPEIFSAGWNTDLALCFAEVKPHVFQLTLEAGKQLSASSMNVKIYSGKGWIREFGGGSYASVESDLIYAGESDGNLHLTAGKTLEIGAPYRFTLDLTAGRAGAVLKFEKVGESAVVADKIAVNGAEATLVGADVYAATVDLKQNEAIAITGVEGIASYWFDPDFFAEGKLNAVDGRYTVTIDKAKTFVLARRVNADGSAPVLGEGGLYIQGWGVASAYMDGTQVGWPGTGGYQLAQVAPGIFQMTGLAVAEKDARLGGRFRYDYISAKYFFQDGWGNEATKGVALSGNAAASLNQGGDGNFGLASNLEDGATYRLTVDFTDVTISGNTITGAETVRFEKL